VLLPPLSWPALLPVLLTNSFFFFRGLYFIVPPDTSILSPSLAAGCSASKTSSRRSALIPHPTIRFYFPSEEEGFGFFLSLFDIFSMDAPLFSIAHALCPFDNPVFITPTRRNDGVDRISPPFSFSSEALRRSFICIPCCIFLCHSASLSLLSQQHDLTFTCFRLFLAFSPTIVQSAPMVLCPPISVPPT